MQKIVGQFDLWWFYLNWLDLPIKDQYWKIFIFYTKIVAYFDSNLLKVESYNLKNIPQKVDFFGHF